MSEDTGFEAIVVIERPLFQGYTPDVALEQALEFFADKFGYTPDEVWQTGGATLAGPILDGAQEGG